MTAPDTAPVARLRVDAAQYHSARPFHVRSNDGPLGADQADPSFRYGVRRVVTDAVDRADA